MNCLPIYLLSFVPSSGSRAAAETALAQGPDYELQQEIQGNNKEHQGNNKEPTGNMEKEPSKNTSHTTLRQATATFLTEAQTQQATIETYDAGRQALLDATTLHEAKEAALAITHRRYIRGRRLKPSSSSTHDQRGSTRGG
jgi:hypothetical protein